MITLIMILYGLTALVAYNRFSMHMEEKLRRFHTSYDDSGRTFLLTQDPTEKEYSRRKGSGIRTVLPGSTAYRHSKNSTLPLDNWTTPSQALLQSSITINTRLFKKYSTPTTNKLSPIRASLWTLSTLKSKSWMQPCPCFD